MNYAGIMGTCRWCQVFNSFAVVLPGMLRLLACASQLVEAMCNAVLPDL